MTSPEDSDEAKVYEVQLSPEQLEQYFPSEHFSKPTSINPDLEKQIRDIIGDQEIDYSLAEGPRRSEEFYELYNEQDQNQIQLEKIFDNATQLFSLAGKTFPEYAFLNGTTQAPYPTNDTKYWFHFQNQDPAPIGITGGREWVIPKGETMFHYLDYFSRFLLSLGDDEKLKIGPHPRHRFLKPELLIVQQTKEGLLGAGIGWNIQDKTPFKSRSPFADRIEVFKQGSGLLDSINDRINQPVLAISANIFDRNIAQGVEKELAFKGVVKLPANIVNLTTRLPVF